MKRIFAAILTIFVLLGAVACSSGDKAPDGYFSVSQDDEIFELYIPQSWQSNMESGISGGYSSLTSGVMVSASAFRGYEDISLADYVDTVIESYRGSLTEFRLMTAAEDTTLGSFAALRFDYQAKSGERVLKFRCTVVKNKDAFVILSCCAPHESFAANEETFESIASYFTFRDFETETEGEFVYEDDKTPAGFQLASRSKLSYRFYVPKTWTVDISGSVPTAYYSSTDASNVNMTVFTLQPTITDEKSYWENYKSTYGQNMTVVSTDENAKLGQYDALAVEYTLDTFRVKQVFLATPSVIYVFTYTSDEAHYAEHMDDVNDMLSLFEIQ